MKQFTKHFLVISKQYLSLDICLISFLGFLSFSQLQYKELLSVFNLTEAWSFGSSSTISDLFLESISLTTILIFIYARRFCFPLDNRKFYLKHPTSSLQLFLATWLQILLTLLLASTAYTIGDYLVASNNVNSLNSSMVVVPDLM